MLALLLTVAGYRRNGCSHQEVTKIIHAKAEENKLAKLTIAQVRQYNPPYSKVWRAAKAPAPPLRRGVWGLRPGRWWGAAPLDSELTGVKGGDAVCYQMVCFLRFRQPEVPCSEKGWKKEVLLERVRTVIATAATLASTAAPTAVAPPPPPAAAAAV